VRATLILGASLLTLVMIACWIAGLWLNDSRWGMTGFIILFASVAPTAIAALVKSSDE